MSITHHMSECILKNEATESSICSANIVTRRPNLVLGSSCWMRLWPVFAATPETFINRWLSQPKIGIHHDLSRSTWLNLTCSFRYFVHSLLSDLVLLKEPQHQCSRSSWEPMCIWCWMMVMMLIMLVGCGQTLRTSQAQKNWWGGNEVCPSHPRG